MNTRAFIERQKHIELKNIVRIPVDVAYTDVGTGVPVVLVHGIPTWSYLFHDTIEKLSQKYRVIAPDMIGFGFSDKRDRFDRGINIQAQLIRKLADYLNLDSFHLVGHDIGGGAALIFGVDDPGRLLSLTLSNSVAYDAWPITAMLKFGNPLKTKEPEDELRETLRSMFSKGILHKDRATDEFCDAMLAPWRESGSLVSLIRDASSLNTNLTQEITEFLPRITCPTCLLWGEKDEFQPISSAERLVHDMPNARLVAIDSKHWVPQDAAGVFAEHLLNFLNDSDTKTMTQHDAADSHRSLPDSFGESFA